MVKALIRTSQVSEKSEQTLSLAKRHWIQPKAPRRSLRISPGSYRHLEVEQEEQCIQVVVV